LTDPGSGSTLLRPAGYVIAYKDGNYMDSHSGLMAIGGKHGPIVRWRSAQDDRWAQMGFKLYEHAEYEGLKDIIAQSTADDLAVILDITVPHHLIIEPGEGAIGSVILSVTRFVPITRLGTA